MFRRSRLTKTVVAGAAVSLVMMTVISPVAASGEPRPTTTPIKHLVVVFQENVSFDHYFATYPTAPNPAGEPEFTSAPHTPSINGLSGALLTPNNPNSAQPFRLGRDQAQTCDQDHSYTNEQKAFDSGLMDKFVETVGRGAGTCKDYGKGKGLVMGYYDGNTVTALWNYAQHFAMSDNSYGTTFGPSTPGALNLVSGQTHGFTTTSGAVTANGTVIGDPQPTADKCSSRDVSTSSDPDNRNIGDLLDCHRCQLGLVPGRLRGLHSQSQQRRRCREQGLHSPPPAIPVLRQHGEPDPRSARFVDEIGHAGPANHQYDLSDFWSAVDARIHAGGQLPEGPGLPGRARGLFHAARRAALPRRYRSTDCRARKDWKSTAVVIAYDDCDGWYDHQMSPIVNQSNDPTFDALTDRQDLRLKPGSDRRWLPGPLRLWTAVAAARYLSICEAELHRPQRPRIKRQSCGSSRTTGRPAEIGNASFDEKAGSLDNMFDFEHRAPKLLPRSIHRTASEPRSI